MIYKKSFNNDFFINEEGIEAISKKLISLVDTYKFSMDSLSILSHIDLSKLTNFYNGTQSLSYEEIHQLYDVVVNVFTIAVETSIHNYNCLLKAKECRSKGIPFIFDEN